MKQSNKSLWAVIIATFLIAGMNSCQKEFFNDHNQIMEESESFAVE